MAYISTHSPTCPPHRHATHPGNGAASVLVRRPIRTPYSLVYGFRSVVVWRVRKTESEEDDNDDNHDDAPRRRHRHRAGGYQRHDRIS